VGWNLKLVPCSQLYKEYKNADEKKSFVYLHAKNYQSTAQFCKVIVKKMQFL